MEPVPAARSDRLLLIGGAILIFLTFMRYGLGQLGWVTFAPFLVFLQDRGTLRRHLTVLAALIVGWLLAVSKIATSEISWIPVPLFGIPIALSYFIALSAAGFVHRRLDARWAIYTFACMTAFLGWIQYAFSPLASWGVLAHTQVNNLPLVQLAAITGLGGITFLMAMGSGLAAAAWTGGLRAIRQDLVVFTVLLGGALLYGEARLAAAASGPTIRVASVVSPVTHHEFAGAYADIDVLRPLDDELFRRSERAAALVAEVVVWNEVATFVGIAGEDALVARGQAFARDRGVLLLMAYGVVETVHPFRYANKYRIYLPDGTRADEYVKRHPVPGDPNTAGIAHARVIAFNGAALSGAICYDYSFPAIARDNTRDGAALALVPASDWRGIDPLHGRMALMNAVAAGLPMVRPVRAATSIATDQYGRLLGSRRADAPDDGVMVLAVPAARVPTIYARTGELVPMAAIGYLVVVIGRAARQPRRRR